MYYANSGGNKFILPGRLRIRVANLKGRKEYAQSIVACLSQIQGITRIEANYYTSNVLVLFDESRIDAYNLEDLIYKARYHNPGNRANPKFPLDRKLREKDKAGNEETGIPVYGQITSALAGKRILIGLSVFSFLIIKEIPVGFLILGTLLASNIAFRYIGKAISKRLEICRNLEGFVPDFAKSLPAYNRQIERMVLFTVIASLILSRSYTMPIGVLLAAYPYYLPAALKSDLDRTAACLCSKGIIIKNTATLETAANIDTIAFEKTGILVSDDLKIGDIMPSGRNSEGRVLQLAACSPGIANQPFGKALIDEAAVRGMHCRVDKKQLLVGNKDLMLHNKISLKGHASKEKKLSHLGQSTVYVAYGGKIAGIIGIKEPVDANSLKAIEAIRQTGITDIRILSGTSKEMVEALAQELGIKTYAGDLLPYEKANIIISEKEQGRTVAMVGSGENDYPALTSSSIGILILKGNGAPSFEYSDVILINGNLMSIPALIYSGKQAMEKAQQSYTLSSGFSIIGIILVAAKALNLYGALIFSSLTGLIVMLNSARHSKYLTKYLDEQVN
ncbi:MAG: HAD-IC family P-type ATPase [Clostridia bacterium]|nr:HAD-IC family P-type ATPase [Clostridia bacterium]